MIILHIREILGGYMKTYVAVYEEGLFDLMGGKTLRGANAPSRPPPHPKRNPATGTISVASSEVCKCD